MFSRRKKDDLNSKMHDFSSKEGKKKIQNLMELSKPEK